MPIVIYRITCKMMNKIYISNMQQHFKMRMKAHFQDVKKLMEKGVHLNLRRTLCRDLAQRSSITNARNAAPLYQM
jgi:predicted DNA-binding transcriptional regulator